VARILFVFSMLQFRQLSRKYKDNFTPSLLSETLLDSVNSDKKKKKHTH